MKYNKLVRSRVPTIIEESGKKATVRVVRGAELLKQLKEKLKEEVEEFLADEAIEELADILEIVYTLSIRKGVPIERLEQFRKLKRSQRGSYDDGIVLEEIFG